MIPRCKQKDKEEHITEQEYATNEYIDGNRVYRKRMLLGVGPDDSLEKSYPIGISSYNIVRINIMMRNGSLAIPLPISSLDSTAIVNYYMNGSNLIIQSGRNRSSFTIRAEIYYIK